MSQFLIGTLLGLASFFVYEFGGQIEGRLFPVMGTLEIHDPEEADDRSVTKWKGHAEKLRNCNFVRLEWYLGPRNGRHVIVDREAAFTDKPQIRSTGRLHWEGILVHLSPKATRENSFADVIHRCPWRPWEVRTRFYTSSNEG